MGFANTVYTALKDITGGATQTIMLSSDRADIDEQWKLIYSLCNGIFPPSINGVCIPTDKCLMGCAIDIGEDSPLRHSEDIKTKGLLENHAYPQHIDFFGGGGVGGVFKI
jgi:hypothetical protein